MKLVSQLAAIVGTGVVYGTDVFCALVQRPALARVDDATLTAVVYQSAAGCRPSTCPALFRGRSPRPSVPGWPQSRRQARLRTGRPPGHIFRAVGRGGSEPLGAGAALVPDDGYRLLLGEPGAGGEGLIEPGCAQPVADLGHQIGLHLPQMRPRR
jgi:hypothetical protein